MRALLLPVLLLLSGCARQLYQVSGDVFALGKPRPPDGFRYGPFAGPPEERLARIVARWEERIKDKQVPGGAIAIVIDGKLALSAGVGEARADTRFRTASISKMIIAATIMRLGIDVHQPVTRYLPYFKRGAEVTVQMLLTHTGGVPDTSDLRKMSLRELIEAHEHEPLWSPPGRLFNYSNADYALLAAIIEEVTHRPFADVVAEQVFAPAGMRTASYTDPRNVGRPLPDDNDASRAAGGVVASAIDFAHFTEMLLAGGAGVLSADAVKEMMIGRALMQKEPESRYGYGLVTGQYAGLDVVEHDGFAYGYTTSVRMVPSRKFAVVVMHSWPFPPNEVANAATSAFLGVAEEDRPRVLTDPKTWTRYTGSYDDPSGALGRFEVTLENEKLWFTPRTSPAGRLPGPLHFTFDDDYAVTRMGVAKKRQPSLRTD